MYQKPMEGFETANFYWLWLVVQCVIYFVPIFI